MESRIKGFSLFDTLMALVLWSIFSLVLFQQQTRQRVFFHRILAQTQTLQSQQNNDEEVLANLPKSQHGFSLLECLWSLAFASLLLMLSMQHYLQSQHMFHQQQIRMAQAMDLQWIENLIRQQIRQAGFTPCLNIDYLQTWNHLNNQPIGAAVDVSHHPESLRLRQMNPHYGVIQKLLNSQTLQIASPSNSVQSGDRVLIADCEHAEVVRVHHHASHVLQFTTPLRFSYTLPAYWGKWEEHQWLMDKNANDERVLFYRQGQRREQWSAAINALQVEWLKARRLVKIGLVQAHQVTTFITHVRT